MSKEKLRTETWLLAVAAGAVLAGATVANAAPVRFDNPPGEGHYEWPSPIGDNTNWLDFTLPASAEPGVPCGHSCLRHVYDPIPPSSKVGTSGEPSPQVEKDSFWVAALELGDSIPSGAPLGSDGYVYYEGYETPWPEGVPTYVGFQFDIGNGTQYGWIGAVRTGYQLDAFAWGYEDEVGVPIAAGAPEPGTLALLAMGAVGALGRRRRA